MMSVSKQAFIKAHLKNGYDTAAFAERFVPPVFKFFVKSSALGVFFSL